MCLNDIQLWCTTTAQPASYNRNVDRCDYNIEKVHLHFLMNLIVRFGLLISNKIRMWQGMWYTLMRKWLIVEWNSLTTIYIFLADILHMRTHWASNYTKIFHIHWIKKNQTNALMTQFSTTYFGQIMALILTLRN